MSAFRNAAKSYQKTHKERSQPEDRQHLGLLEKKKDYRRRASEHHKRENTLKALRKKALDKNPDEFYFNMVRSKMVDGKHQCEDQTPVHTDDQLKLMQSQDIRYVQYKRSVELKKIERLKANLQLLDVSEGKPVNEHVIFLDKKSEVEKFDPAKYFNTHPDLVNRTYNRPTLEMLGQKDIIGKLDERSLAEMAVERKRLYTELSRRIEREKQLKIVEEKLSVNKLLLDKKAKKKKVADESVSAPAIYRWVPVRKR